MAVASSCREVSCQVRQRSRPTSIVAAEEVSPKSKTVETAADKAEEGVGHGRSVCPESLGPHASCNGRDSELPTSREEGNL